MHSISTDSLQHNIPETKKFNYIENVSIQGTISNEFNYGLLTGYIDSMGIDPMSVFVSRGEADLRLKSLPLTVAYRYSNWHNPIGINNFFRVRLDTEALKDNAKKKLEEQSETLAEKKHQISENRSYLQQKVGYGEILLNQLNKQRETLEKEALSYKHEMQTQLRDSINSTKDGYSEKTRSKLDSLQQKQLFIEQRLSKIDSLYNKLNTVYTTAYSVYSSLQRAEDSIRSLQNKVTSQLDEVKSGGVVDSKLNQIKTLELGLTYPKSTALSKNTVPMQGVNLELQRDQWYASVAAGILKSNLNVSPNLIENKLNNSQNLFNQFDFQNLTQEQFMAVVKSGIGSPEKSHAFLGIRYLKARNLDNISDSTNYPSLGLELETKYLPKFLPSATIDFVYGKTSMHGRSVIPSIFSSDRTNSALIQYEQKLGKLRSKIIGTFRILDPFAEVKNLGVLQPNNVRYMLQSQHKLTKRLRVGLNYRHDENNVAQLSDTTDRFDMVGGTFNGSIGRLLTYFGTANYLVQRKDEINTRLMDRSNYILGAGLSIRYQIFKNPSALIVSYNDYLITDSLGTGVFSNFGVENAVQFDNGKWIQSAQYFTTDYFGAFTASTIFSEKYEYNFENLKLGAEIKYALSNQRDPSLGWGVEASFSFLKQFEWVLKAEKFVLGDYYSTFNRERFDRFPYRIMTQLNWKFNY